MASISMFLRWTAAIDCMKVKGILEFLAADALMTPALFDVYECEGIDVFFIIRFSI